MNYNFRRQLLIGCGSLFLNFAVHATQESNIDEAIIRRKETTRPNVIVILADDLGYTDIGSYGSEVHTPNLDRLADQGQKFSNYHTSPSCAPSRAMLLTGVDNHLAGVPNIPEALPGEQKGKENYTGVLSPNVATVASILQSEGYHTYMTGKWHLGKADNLLPYNRGFERTLSMADTGADNWEQRPYMAMYDHAHWTRDGKETKLNEPFYSSELLVDEMIEYIDSNLSDDQPFFSFLSFLAVHMPVQAPKEFTDKYMETYKEGWEALRESRHRSAMENGLVPENSGRVTHDFLDDWDSLSEDEQHFEAKRMAVYAGMISAMDFHIGRLLEYLDEKGELDNTVIIFTSDNGPEYNTVGTSALEDQGYTYEYENLGEIGSFNYIGPNFANAAASPLSYFKFYHGEGGLRVPLIISGSGIKPQAGFIDASVHVTDITPTILGLTGVEHPDGRFGGRRVEPITGKNLEPLLYGTVEEIYQPDEYRGFEVAGNKALINNGFKIVLNRKPLGDGQWYMYDIVNDPGETVDLKAENPVQFQKMLNLYMDYVKEKGVLPVPDYYTQTGEVGQKLIRKMAGDQIVTIILSILTLGLFALLGRKKRS